MGKHKSTRRTSVNEGIACFVTVSKGKEGEACISIDKNELEVVKIDCISSKAGKDQEKNKKSEDNGRQKRVTDSDLMGRLRTLFICSCL